MFQNGLFYPFPCWKLQGIFLWYLLKESDGNPEGKFNNIVWASLLWPGLLGDFISRSWNLQQFVDYSSSFSTPALFFTKVWACECLLQVSCNFLYSFVSVSPILGAVVFSSYGSENNCWFFSLFSLFTYCWSREYWLPISLYAEIKTANPGFLLEVLKMF